MAAWDVSSRYVLHGIKSLVAALLLFAAAVALTPAKETHAPGLKLAERRKPVGAAHKSAAARPQETERKAASAKPAVALVSGNDVAIREAPRDNARVLGVAVFGTMVDVTTQDGKWAQVRTGGQGAGGWVEKAGLHF